MASPSLGKVMKVIMVLSFHLCLMAIYKILPLPLVRIVHQSGLSATFNINSLGGAMVDLPQNTCSS